MAKRTADQTSIDVPKAVKAQLAAYRAALQRDLNRTASYGDIIGALLWGVPLWQANAMIDAHRPQGDPRDDPGADEGDP